MTSVEQRREENRNEFADVRKDGVIPCIEALAAISEGQAIPDDVKTRLLNLAARLQAARVVRDDLAGAPDTPPDPEAGGA